MKKAIIFDLDGTVMPSGNDWGLPSERLKKAVHSLKSSHNVTVASGRNLHYARHIIEFLEINELCIIAAGTEMYDPSTKNIVWRESIPTGCYDQIKHALRNNQNFAFSGDVNDSKYNGSTVQGLLDGKVSVIYILAVDPLEATEIVNELQHPELHIINMHSFSDDTKRDIHIHSVKASKEHAVAELLKRLGVKKENSIVIGDGLNDLHLFVAGGTKVAMGNAAIELKEAADIVIGDVSEDGLAEYLESLA